MIQKYEGISYAWLSNQKAAKALFRFYPDHRLQIGYLEVAENFY